MFDRSLGSLDRERKTRVDVHRSKQGLVEGMRPTLRDQCYCQGFVSFLEISATFVENTLRGVILRPPIDVFFGHGLHRDRIRVCRDSGKGE